MAVTFVDELPPAQTNARAAVNREFAAELRSRPGEYAPYPYDLASPSSFRYRVNNGKVVAFGDGFVADVRGGKVFVAYTGTGA
ncbi:hypothetical protein [Rhodococcoides fascians]|uniref:hypothetical protein n=1 Tax=Rhodococcoides fascians TaxID=1828 RepID=UPI00050C9B0C|nr:hypothetical protein [Rhodococcus fascians]